MRTSTRDGWVMVNRESDYIMEWTFCGYRRDTIGLLKEQFPTYSRAKILRRWKPVKAIQTTEVVVDAA